MARRQGRGVGGLRRGALRLQARRDPGNDDLHAADVPVRPLLEDNEDPCAKYAEKFPMQVAVYWTKPDESVLEVEHALGQRWAFRFL